MLRQIATLNPKATWKFHQANELLIHPIAEVNLSAFDKIEKDFSNWIQSCLNNRFKFLTKDTISLKLWHINGAPNRICPKQVLYTFYELDEPTDVERCIVGLQDTTIFSSANSARSFAFSGLGKVYSVPLGFDSDFFKTSKTYLEGKTHFILKKKAY